MIYHKNNYFDNMKSILKLFFQVYRVVGLVAGFGGWMFVVLWCASPIISIVIDRKFVPIRLFSFVLPLIAWIIAGYISIYFYKASVVPWWLWGIIIIPTGVAVLSPIYEWIQEYKSQQ